MFLKILGAKKCSERNTWQTWKVYGKKEQNKKNMSESKYLSV